MDTMPMTPSPASPVSFGDNFAFYHPGDNETGYVFCGSWGYDEMCSRKFLRLIAQDLANEGAPVLRFDYPGTVNMLDDPESTDLESWVNSASSAADRLKTLSGCKKIVFVGIGIGSAIAFLAAKDRLDVAGLILNAPVVSGRRYMREQQIQAQVADESLGFALQGKHGDTGFTGFFIPDALQSSLKSIKLSPDGFKTKPTCLIVCREGNATEKDFAQLLCDADWPVKSAPFTGYLQLLATPTTSVLPLEVMAQISDFAKTHFGTEDHALQGNPPETEAHLPTIKGDAFTESPVLFGHNNGLFGVLCEPKGPRYGPVLVFLNTGYCHHIGWGRIYVTAARFLAQRGIATFRFDMAGVGESPSIEGRAEQVLYTDDQLDDADQTVKYLKTHLPGPLFMIGRCSGAYVAFHTAARNRNVDGVMMINQLKMIWDPGEDVYEAVNFGARPLEEYRRRALSLTTFKRILRGEVNLRKAGSHIANHLRERTSRKLAPYVGSLSKLGRFRKECHARFETMNARGIPVELLNCESDGSLDELANYFGPDLSGLSAFPNVNRTIVPRADHNLTPKDAQEFLLAKLAEFAENPNWAEDQ
jgi:pimeloyl-ACP methyl ester carboxylesterase